MSLIRSLESSSLRIAYVSSKLSRQLLIPIYDQSRPLSRCHRPFHIGSVNGYRFAVRADGRIVSGLIASSKPRKSQNSFRCFSVAAGDAMAWLESLDDGNLDLNNLEFTRQKLEKAVLAGEEFENWQVQRLSLACLAAAGIGGERDILLAESCLLSVAESGNTEAMFRLAELYLDSPNDSEDKAGKEPDIWAESESEQSNHPALNEISRVVDPTLAKAVRCAFPSLFPNSRVRHAVFQRDTLKIAHRACMRRKQILDLVRQAKIAKQRGAPLSHIPPPSAAAAATATAAAAAAAAAAAGQGAAQGSLYDVAKAAAWLRRAAAAGHPDSQASRRFHHSNLFDHFSPVWPLEPLDSDAAHPQRRTRPVRLSEASAMRALSVRRLQLARRGTVSQHPAPV
jgi:TPR repeat protein